MEQVNSSHEDEVPVSKLYKKAAEIGIICGFAGIAIGVLVYLAGVETTAKWWMGILIFVAMIVLYVLFALQIKKKAGMKVISYWQAFFAVMILMAVSSVMYNGFNLLLTRVIDKDYNENMKNAVIQNTAQFMQDMGTPQEQIDQTIDEMIKGFDEQKNVTPKGIIVGLIYSIIWFAVFSFIMAIFVRKKQPVFDPNLTPQ